MENSGVEKSSDEVRRRNKKSEILKKKIENLTLEEFWRLSE